MTWQSRIEVNPKVLVGKPVVKGTRIAVERILVLKAQGQSDREILEDHPRLELDDIRACMAYAAELVGAERVLPMPAA